MKLSKFDIGAEIIAILTRGMYQDPRDALREYIQNGVDAHAENIKVKIRQDSIVIEDDGSGMEYPIMRKALRIGVSDKQPGKDVGFMGIGIYSSFHLCDMLAVYSRVDGKLPCKLEIDFKTMREILADQRELRLQEKITSEDLIDLQSLLEKAIFLSDEGIIEMNEFPGTGTRVELTGLAPHFYEELTDFEKVTDYLRDVVPLHFDKNRFTYGQKIEEEITKICQKSNTRFELVNIEIQVNNRKEKLFRPYRDDHFYNSQPQEPVFKEIKENGRLLGVTWGCLNSARKKIAEKKLRGFLLKKQGFAIGTRESVVQHFGSRTHFDRYIGEIIVTYPGLLPNSSRDDLELTPMRTSFYKNLVKIASELVEISNNFQEQTKARDTIGTSKEKLKEINASFNRYEKDPDRLVGFIVELNEILEKVKSISRRKILEGNEKEDVEKLKNSLEDLIKEIKGRINSLTKTGGKKSGRSIPDKKITIAQHLASITIKEIQEKKYESVNELLEDLDVELPDELAKILSLIDEKFIQGYASSKMEYYKILNRLKEEIINSKY